MINERDYAIKNYEAVLQADGSYIDRYGDITWFNEAGKYHREDGPSIIYPDGSLYWYINGHNYYSFMSWFNDLHATDEAKLLLKLQYS
jgi:hypothetical protein